MRFIAHIIAIIIAMVLMGLTAFLYGITWTFFWSWFIVPAFGVGAINYTHGVGLAMMTSLFQRVRSADVATSTKVVRSGKLVYYRLSRPVVILLLGYLIHLILS